MTEFIIAVIMLLGAGMQCIAWKLRVPAILLLLLTGLFLGPSTHLLDPDQLIGHLFFPLVSLSVAVILFEGALTLHLDQLKDIGKVVYRLCTIGAFVTCLVIALAAYFLLQLSWQIAFLLGSVLVVTGPTVISSMLRNLRPTVELDRILRWEGIVIDPLGALYAVLIYEAMLLQHRHESLHALIFDFIQIASLGLGVGLLLGWFVALIFRKQWVPFDLQKFTLLAIVLFAFSVSHVIQEDSGLLTVTVMGIFLANQRDLDLEPILTFKEDLSLIFISLLFIFLAARVNVSQLMTYGVDLLFFLLVIQFVARPLTVIVSTFGHGLSWQAKALLCWVAPRGIVAAAVASAFAVGLAKANIPDTQELVPLTFAVIIFTVVLQSLTAPLFARLLGVQQARPRTVLIVGANHLAREIGKALLEQDIPIYLTDSIWENYRLARMSGLPSFYGKAQSEYAERVIPMNQITTMLALSPDINQNAMAVQYFADRLGAQHVYSIRASEQNASDAKQETAIFRSRQTLFGTDVTYASLTELMTQGGRITKTTLGENFSLAHYSEYHQDSTPLFIVDEKKNLQIFSANMDRVPKSGDTILSLAKAKHVVNVGEV